jgi:glycosyltransferase involved in cell wall biosynthesis
MRILRITPSFASSTNPGSGTNSYFHSKYSKYKSYILTEDRRLEYLEVADNVRIKKVKTLNKGLGEVGDRKFFMNLIYKFFSTFIFTIKSIRFLHSVKPQIVHLYSPIYLLTGLYCKVFFGSKIVLSIHGTDGLRIQNFKPLRLIFRLTDLNLSLSKKFIKKINIKDIEYLGNGFDNSLFYLFNKYYNIRDKYIITVGNLRWQKDHKSMIEAFDIFHKSHTDYKLLIVGEGKLRNQLEIQIQELNLQDSVFLYGKREQKDIAELMNLSELFFLSSTTEGSPKVIYEAMACGLPILSTNVGDVKENTTNETSVIVDVDVHEMAKGLSEIIDHRTFDRIFISEDVKKKSWKYVSENLDRIYEGIR